MCVCKYGARISRLKRAGEGGEGGAASRGSPHLVVLGGECCSASEEGVAQPGGVGVSGDGLSIGLCWVTAVAQAQTLTTTAAMEEWTIHAVTSTTQCRRRVHTVEASRRAALRVFNPKQEAACSCNVTTSTIVPCCSCVAAEGESIRGPHDDQRRPLPCSVTK
jgi:hypothetical protein